MEKPTPSDKARAAAPSIGQHYKDFARIVYPDLDPESAQYKEMEMVWHVASLNFLEVLAKISEEHDEDEGADVIQCVSEEVNKFLQEYGERRRAQSDEGPHSATPVP